jgi:hypothetical protein
VELNGIAGQQGAPPGKVMLDLPGEGSHMTLASAMGCKRARSAAPSRFCRS